jgi:hypothetical protein
MKKIKLNNVVLSVVLPVVLSACVTKPANNSTHYWNKIGDSTTYAHIYDNRELYYADVGCHQSRHYVKCMNYNGFEYHVIKETN